MALDLKALVTMEIQKGERIFRFIMDNGSSYGEAIDAAYEFLTKLHEISQEAVKNAQPVKEAQAK